MLDSKIDLNSPKVDKLYPGVHDRGRGSDLYLIRTIIDKATSILLEFVLTSMLSAILFGGIAVLALLFTGNINAEDIL